MEQRLLLVPATMEMTKRVKDLVVGYLHAFLLLPFGLDAFGHPCLVSFQIFKGAIQ